MKCPYCKARLNTIDSIDDFYEFFTCFNHKPTKVEIATNKKSDIIYTQFSNGDFGDQSIIWINYDWNNSKIFINNKFIYLDHMLNVTPENFESKIKSLLAFL